MPEQSGSGNRWRERAVKASVLLASTALALLVGELVIRAADLFSDQRAATLVTATDEPAEAPAATTGDDPVTDLLVHPFLGWTRRPRVEAGSSQGSEWTRRNGTSNRFGFFSEIDDYRDLTAEDFKVGIFGGSVANGLALFGGDAFAAELEKRLPELSGRRIRVLNFGLGGYKQPQQLMLLGEMIVLGVDLDAVVNVDGFNELAIGVSDANLGYHPIFPSRAHYAGALALQGHQLTADELLLAAEVERSRRGRDTLRRRVAEGTFLGRFELARAVAGTLVQRAERHAAAVELRLQADVQASEESTIAQISDPCLRRGKPCWTLIADLWQRSSVAMKALAESTGAAYVHILQPNQYVAGSKSFTPQELDSAYRPDDGWSRVAAQGYPLLQSRAANLRRAGVAFYDLTGIFTNETGTIYKDSCCHYNHRGNQIFGREAARAVAETLASRR